VNASLKVRARFEFDGYRSALLGHLPSPPPPAADAVAMVREENERLVPAHVVAGVVRLSNGAEIHNSKQLEDLGLGIAHAAHPFRGAVNGVAVPKGGWRRFFEYVVLERETGISCAGGTHSGVEVRYRLMGT
jgi:hypothetical protein